MLTQSSERSCSLNVSCLISPNCCMNLREQDYDLRLKKKNLPIPATCTQCDGRYGRFIYEEIIVE